ncbi:hypothetical protein EDD86DRAFT_53478 [Gorgonomyces haynaldii]|nr:hypothetical protein EDD86DRAFT_53478 [Gorgonomyces haynaldii]
MILISDSLMGTSSLNYRSMFTGMALDMKLNENPAEAMTQEEHEENCVRINCFWYVYIGDHFTSVVLGTAPLIHDTQILVPLPISREEFNLEVFKRRRPTVPYEIGIISSMSGFIPIPPFVNQTSMYILLIKIYSLINRYIQSLKKTNPNAPSYENDYMQGCLKASLTEWKSKMPLVPDGFEPSQQFTTKWWQVYYIVIYSSAVISLNTAKLTIPGEHDPTELLFSPSFLECIEAAKKITEIVSMLVEHNAFGNHGIQRYVSLGIFSSSIIHEILIRIHPDEAQVQLARVNFETNMKAAQFLANTGLPNLLQYQRLKERHANLPQQQASPPGFETLFSFYFDPNTDVNPALFPDQMIQPELFTSDLSFLS